MNTAQPHTGRTPQSHVWWALGVLLGLRLLSLACYPLTDNTEARYAEIGRVMWSQGDWVTPWFDAGVPFWGKPPLSFWTTAVSFGLFGVNEFAARLPHFLTGLLVGWLTWAWGSQWSKQAAMTTVALLAGSSLMLLASGAVMTDMVLLLGCTLVMRGFWLGLHGDPDQQTREGWLFFIGLAIGLLAKGPLILVLAGLPIGLWTLWHGQWMRVWRALPWLRGLAMMTLLVLPWYVLAEMRTPGFLDYFLVGEHWHRFVTPGWAGDRYGGAHQAARGTIWLYAWVALLPWSLVLPVAAWYWRKARLPRPATPTEASLRWYLAIWALAPALFFTMAGNILWTYVLPALPAVALLLGRYLSALPDPRSVNRLLAGGLWLMSVLLVGLVVGLNLRQAQDWHTNKHLVAHYDASAKTHPPAALIFYPVRPYSAAFYSQGRALHFRTPEVLMQRLSEGPAYLAIKTADLSQLPAMPQVRMQLQAELGEFSLFLSAPEPAANTPGKP